MKYFNIPIFVAHEGCPFDCIFCNQRKITGVDTSMTAPEVTKIITEHLETLPRDNSHIEVAFFGGSFTGISPQKQEEFLSIAKGFLEGGKIDGIRLSTRPDFISDEVLKRLKNYGVTMVELGVQSMCDEVLLASRRGHTKADVINAAHLIKSYEIGLGLQMMTGLPGDTPERSVATAREIAALNPDAVRIYPTLVLSETALYKMYENGEYVPQDLDEAVLLAKKLLEIFKEKNIPVIRVGLATTDVICSGGAIAAGPYHPAFRELCEGEFYYDAFEKLLCENPDVTAVSVKDTEVSRAVGIAKRNIIKIKEKYGIDLLVKPDASMEKGSIKIWKE